MSGKLQMWSPSMLRTASESVSEMTVITTKQVKTRKIVNGDAIEKITRSVTITNGDGKKLPFTSTDDLDLFGLDIGETGRFDESTRKKQVSVKSEKSKKAKKSVWSKFTAWLQQHEPRIDEAVETSRKEVHPALPKSVITHDKNDKQFEKECLKWHNHYRALHGVPPLKLNPKLTHIAKEWAERCALKDVMEHRPNNEYGENIYMKWSSDPTFNVSPEDPVVGWYGEIKMYTFGKEPSSTKTGHFTQVVWKESKEVGIGRARSVNNKIYVVANYNPPGNYKGRYVENVPPPLK